MDRFHPLSGFSSFIHYHNLLLVNWRISFHPLSGFSSFIQRYTNDIRRICRVSIPCRGFLLIYPTLWKPLFKPPLKAGCMLKKLSPHFNDNILQNSLHHLCNVHHVKTNLLSYIIPFGKDFPNNMYTSMYVVIPQVSRHPYWLIDCYL